MSEASRSTVGTRKSIQGRALEVLGRWPARIPIYGRLRSVLIMTTMKYSTLVRTLLAVIGLSVVCAAEAQTLNNPYYIKDVDNIVRNNYYFFSSFALAGNQAVTPGAITAANNSGNLILVIDDIEAQCPGTLTFMKVVQIGPNSSNQTITKGIILFPFIGISGYGTQASSFHRFVLEPGDSLKVFFGRQTVNGVPEDGTVLFTGYVLH